MRRGYVAAIVGAGILLGHLGLIPFVFSMNTLLTSQKLEVLLLVGPITAASVVTAVQFAMRNAASRLDQTEEVNAFFVFVAVTVPAALLAFIYIVCILKQRGDITDAAQLKSAIGVLELFMGASYALVVDSLFGGSQGANNPQQDGNPLG